MKMIGRKRVATLIAVSLASASAMADVLHVSNRGTDNSTCGLDVDHACRSISRAIEHADPGDTVLVGPGFYGDINRDKDFNDAGDEAIYAPDDSVDGCVVCIHKRVRVLSTHGAAATRIEAIDTLKFTFGGPYVDLVRIDTSGVTFGTPGHGFELAGPAYRQLVVFHAGDVAVGGNIATRWKIEYPRDFNWQPDTGFYAEAAGGTVTFTQNQAIRNHVGFYVVGTGPVVLINNAALQNSENGFTAYGLGARRFIGNYSSGNGDSPPIDVPDLTLLPVEGAGFNIRAADVRLEDNLASGNFGPGFLLSAAQAPPASKVIFMKHNASTGNGGAGVEVAAGTRAGVRSNNIFGNLGKGSGCGLLNTSGRTLDATGNFWGRATGPGADPADKAGPDSGCDQQTGSVTRVAPFATAELAVVP